MYLTARRNLRKNEYVIYLNSNEFLFFIKMPLTECYLNILFLTKIYFTYSDLFILFESIFLINQYSIAINIIYSYRTLLKSL